ncbi:MAG: alpha/beta fold hydrolase [Hyphomicrobiaceae bacterium]
MPDLPDLFPGFATHTITNDGLNIHARVGGSGPALLCLHGYPQTHVCWRRVAPVLAQNFTVVAMDLRGYGTSSAPPGDSGHTLYAKRAMASDGIALMRALGFDKFHVMGHDRGARVAYRMALDSPKAVDKLILLDIIPTIEQWDAMTARRAISSYHWQFLAQPAPLPETLIEAAPHFYLDWTIKSWTKDRSVAAMGDEAMVHYRALFDDRQRIHALCEDYRAGATFDRQVDALDRDQGRKIAAPTLILWGSDYLGRGDVAPLEVWQRWCDSVVGQEIVSGHFLAEENPTDTAAAVLEFLES